MYYTTDGITWVEHQVNVILNELSSFANSLFFFFAIATNVIQVSTPYFGVKGLTFANGKRNETKYRKETETD